MNSKSSPCIFWTTIFQQHETILCTRQHSLYQVHNPKMWFLPINAWFCFKKCSLISFFPSTAIQKCKFILIQKLWKIFRNEIRLKYKNPNNITYMRFFPSVRRCLLCYDRENQFNCDTNRWISLKQMPAPNW